MRVIFLGTPEFAVPSLKALVSAGHQILAVFTQPDRPKGRGNQLAESPVKVAARMLSLPVYQPERIRRPEAVEQLRPLAADLMVVVGYGQIIPQTIIDLPPYGILNVHASLLPKYRGAAPIQWAIANGEKQTGVTIMQIDAGLDTGDMLLKASAEIHPDETAPELSKRLATLGADLLIGAIKQIEEGRVRREKQDHSQATLAPILKKEDGRIDWSRTAQQIYDRLRGFDPWPGAYTAFRQQPLNIVRAAPKPHAALNAGTVEVGKRHLLVGCGDKTALELLEVQPSGKKRMSAEAFTSGYKPVSGERMGEEQ
ncbi:MAG: methionyl-tRNA formyltransferase [Bryobacteraceae bacterium]